MTNDKQGDLSRLPGLDGLRAAAVILVLLSHFADPPASVPIVARAIQAGGFGVEIFFVLSGFLITYLLIKEERSIGRISLSLFYARRSLRILPPLIAYLTALAAATIAGWINIPPIDLWASLLFIRNYFGSTPETGHLWTLAIEEQYYLLWPALLVLVHNFRFRIGITAAFVFLSPLWIQLCYRWADGAEHINSWRTDIRLAPLAVGSLLAMVLATHRGHWFLSRSTVRGVWIATVAITTLIVVQLTSALDVPIIRAYRATISWLAVAILINCLIHDSRAVLTRLAQRKPIVWIGHLSYSIYLWQQPFAPHVTGADQSVWYRAAPVNIAFAISCDIASYYIIERPLMSLRKRLQPIANDQSRTPNRPSRN
ncbi:acyltransferase family protein [Gemmata algarum]|uniref:acyltransferase family protein n=1 Tax=Gemmata algarum TaxID=2975278 RepID=UPI0039C99DE1